jgi:hypothetical protein
MRRRRGHGTVTDTRSSTGVLIPMLIRMIKVTGLPRCTIDGRTIWHDRWSDHMARPPTDSLTSLTLTLRNSERLVRAREKSSAVAAAAAEVDDDEDEEDDIEDEEEDDDDEDDGADDNGEPGWRATWRPKRDTSEFNSTREHVIVGICPVYSGLQATRWPDTPAQVAQKPSETQRVHRLAFARCPFARSVRWRIRQCRL